MAFLLTLQWWVMRNERGSLGIHPKCSGSPATCSGQRGWRAAMGCPGKQSICLISLLPYPSNHAGTTGCLALPHPCWDGKRLVISHALPKIYLPSSPPQSPMLIAQDQLWSVTIGSSNYRCDSQPICAKDPGHPTELQADSCKFFLDLFSRGGIERHRGYEHTSTNCEFRLR